MEENNNNKNNITTSVLENLKPIIDSFYNLEEKDEEGNVIIPLPDKSVAIEVGSTFINVITTLFNKLMNEYTKKNNIDIAEAYKRLSKGINDIVEISVSGNKDKELDIDVDMFIICYLKIFRETWYRTMIDNNLYTTISKEDYYKDAEKMISSSELFKKKPS